ALHNPFEACFACGFRDYKLVLCKSPHSVDSVPVCNAVQRIKKSLVIYDRLLSALGVFMIVKKIETFYCRIVEHKVGEGNRYIKFFLFRRGKLRSGVI